MKHSKHTLATVLLTVFLAAPLAHSALAEDPMQVAPPRMAPADFGDIVRQPWLPDGDEMASFRGVMKLEGLQTLFAAQQNTFTDVELGAIADGLRHCVLTLPNEGGEQTVFDAETAEALFPQLCETLTGWKADGLGIDPGTLSALFQNFSYFVEGITLTDMDIDGAEAAFDIRIFLNRLYELTRDGGGDKDMQGDRLKFITDSAVALYARDSRENHLYNLGLMSRIFTDAEDDTEWANTILDWVHPFTNNNLGIAAWDEIYNIVVPYMVQKHAQNADFDFDRSEIQGAWQKLGSADEEDTIAILKQYLGEPDAHPEEDENASLNRQAE